eukprot:symbB.v1.2.013950.t1/scaffold895.1/size184301/1
MGWRWVWNPKGKGKGTGTSTGAGRANNATWSNTNNATGGNAGTSNATWSNDGTNNATWSNAGTHNATWTNDGTNNATWDSSGGARDGGWTSNNRGGTRYGAGSGQSQSGSGNWHGWSSNQGAGYGSSRDRHWNYGHTGQHGQWTASHWANDGSHNDGDGPYSRSKPTGRDKRSGAQKRQARQSRADVATVIEAVVNALQGQNQNQQQQNQTQEEEGWWEWHNESRRRRRGAAADGDGGNGAAAADGGSGTAAVAGPPGVGLSNADFIAMTQFVGVRPVVNLIDDDAAPAGPIGPPPAVVAPMMGPDPPAAAPEVAPEGDGDVAMDDVNDEGQDSNLLATSSQFFLFFFGMASGSQDEDILEVPSETEVDGMALTQMHKESGLSTPAQPGDCCLDCCLAAFEENAALKTRVNEIKASLNGSTLAEKNAIVFEVLKTWLAHHGFAEARGHRVFLAWNIPLCVKATCEILQVSRQKLQKLKSWILEGHSNPPQDGRSLVVKATSSEALACHMILSWASRP